MSGGKRPSAALAFTFFPSFRPIVRLTDGLSMEGAALGREGFGTTSRDGGGAFAQPWAGPFFVTGPSVLEKIFELREAVWRNEPGLIDARGLEAAMLPDAHDDHGLHWIIEAKGSVVAAARLCIHDDKKELPYEDGFHHLITDLRAPIASFNRLVVHPSMRRRGLSRVLTVPRIEAARARGARSIIVEAAPNRIPPLRELGFVELGYCVNQPGYLARFTLMKLDIPA